MIFLLRSDLEFYFIYADKIIDFYDRNVHKLIFTSYYVKYAN